MVLCIGDAGRCWSSHCSLMVLSRIEVDATERVTLKLTEGFLKKLPYLFRDERLAARFVLG